MTQSAVEGLVCNMVITLACHCPGSQIRGYRSVFGPTDILLIAPSANHQSASSVRPCNSNEHLCQQLVEAEKSTLACVSVCMCVCVCGRIPVFEVPRGSEVRRMQPLISPPGGASLTDKHRHAQGRAHLSTTYSI